MTQIMASLQRNLRFSLPHKLDEYNIYFKKTCEQLAYSLLQEIQKVPKLTYFIKQILFYRHL